MLNKDNVGSMNKVENDEIDIIAIFETIKDNKRKIAKIVIIFFVFGLFFAIFTPKKYSSSTIFIPQGASGKPGGNLGGLAALAGFSLGSGGNDSGIPLSLYTEILNSTPFQKELVKLPLYKDKNNKDITYEDYYLNVYSPGLIFNIKKYTVGLPNVIIKKIKGDVKEKALISSDSIYFTSSTELKLFNHLREDVSLFINDKDNSVTVSGIMPEPLLAAGLTFNTQKLLEKYILNFKIEKSIIKLDFIKDRFNEAEKIYTQKQYQLASYQDRNKYLVSAKSQTRLATLKGEFNLSYEVYSELAKQLETQKIQVKEDTPVFTTVKPVLVPVEKNAPKRMVIIFVFTVLGLLLAITTVLLKEKYLLLTDKKK